MFLLGVWPVLFLFAENIAEVQLRDALPFVGRGLVAASVLVLAAALVLRDLRRGALVAGALLAAWFGYGHVAELLRPAAVPRDVLLGGWAALVISVAAAAVLLRERPLARLTALLNVLLGVLVILSLVRIVPVEVSREVAAAEAPTRSDIPRPDPAPGARDVWYLVFDRYGSESSLQALAGIDNDLPDWLEARGFQVARDAHANYGRTTMSLASTLRMGPLDDVVASQGPASREAAPVNDLLQDHPVGRFFQAQGYRYVHLGSWFGATKTVRISDENPTLDSATDFEVVLDRTTFGPTLTDLRDVPDPPRHHVLHRSTALFQLRELERIRDEAGPKLVIGHVLLPHEPYVFDEQGDYPTPEERAARSLDEGYRRQLIFTNDRIKALVEELLAVPEAERPIIILAGDEGPYPDRYAADQNGFDWGTATTEELETKFGILMAMYLPRPVRPDAIAPYDTMTTMNLFPVVLSHYWAGDWALAPDRSWASAGWQRPYDLTDITDRLPPPVGSAAPPVGDAPSPGTPGPSPGASSASTGSAEPG